MEKTASIFQFTTETVAQLLFLEAAIVLPRAEVLCGYHPRSVENVKEMSQGSSFSIVNHICASFRAPLCEMMLSFSLCQH